ncbi:hypothetical protein CTI14_54980, partial [Methylobacterium radiotolerans]
QVDRLKEIPKKIDAERKRMRETLDALADEVRARWTSGSKRRKRASSATSRESSGSGCAPIASLAFKVRKVKTALDGIGKDQVDRLKEIPKKIDAERKRMRETLDALADEVRA